MRFFILVLVYCPSLLAIEKKVFPSRQWQKAQPETVGLDPNKLEQAKEYALTGSGSGFITRHGKLVLSWGDINKKYDLKSTTKSIGITALGVAIKDNEMQLDAQASRYHPALGVPPESNQKTGWLSKITIQHLATQTAGFEKRGDYRRLLFEPGTKWHYSDGGPNWLAECITLQYKQDLEKLLFERIFTPLGITAKDLHWRRHAYRPKTINDIPRREMGSGIHANVDAMARIGLLYLRKGQWNDKQLLTEAFIKQVRSPVKGVIGLPEYDKTHGNASDHYGLLWWNNADGSLKGVPRDAYWSWGLYDSLIVVIPSLDMVISRAGRGWKRKSTNHYDVLRPFLTPIVASVTKPTQSRIQRIEWAPKSTIIRRAKGSDNWPMTWGDDDALYTAYGDGWGFEPRVKKKLSLGIAKVIGGPTTFKGINIRSSSIEQYGGGANGKKASGILMVKGVLYLWVRNAKNSQLAWSKDHGQTWKWADWRFTESFGCPTFLNFGKNYQGSRDEYVYIYSFDSDSAYQPADQMVLARVHQDKILTRSAYEFFTGIKKGQPTWHSNLNKRQSVLSRKGQCYRSGISYNAGLKRYLWVILPGGDTRYQGGFSVYESPKPWGPWREIETIKNWDVGPGESASFPTKWMSEDGKTIHLVFSGNDCFSVRKAHLILKP